MNEFRQLQSALIFALLIAAWSTTSVLGLGVGYLSGPGNPLEMYPGETELYWFQLQSAPGEGIIRQTIVEDPWDIASLPGGVDYVDYSLPDGGWVNTPVIMTIPADFQPGEYLGRVAWMQQGTDDSGGTIGILTGIEVGTYVRVLSLPTPPPAIPAPPAILLVGMGAGLVATMQRRKGKLGGS